MRCVRIAVSQEIHVVFFGLGFSKRLIRDESRIIYETRILITMPTFAGVFRGPRKITNRTQANFNKH